MFLAGLLSHRRWFSPLGPLPTVSTTLVILVILALLVLLVVWAALLTTRPLAHDLLLLTPAMVPAVPADLELTNDASLTAACEQGIEAVRATMREETMSAAATLLAEAEQVTLHLGDLAACSSATDDDDQNNNNDDHDVIIIMI